MKADTVGSMFTLPEKEGERIINVLEKIYSAAQPRTVYSEPMTIGHHTIVMASEIAVGGGLGSGSGFGSPTPLFKEQGETAALEAQSRNSAGGLGGGGGSSGRPVAIIIIGPDGVTVKPVVDVTKIVLAIVTALGVVVMLLRGLQRVNKYR